MDVQLAGTLMIASISSMRVQVLLHILMMDSSSSLLTTSGTTGLQGLSGLRLKPENMTGMLSIRTAVPTRLLPVLPIMILGILP